MIRYPLTLCQFLQLADIPASVIARLPHGVRELQVQDLVCDSRDVGHGTVFVAIPGTRVDGHQFLLDAATAGAVCAIVQKSDPTVPLPQIATSCPASAYSRLCIKLSTGAVNPIQVAGVTGTNGKTTTTWMLQSILQASGKQTGAVGTICHHDGLRQLSSSMTTPDAKTLGELFRTMLQNRTTHCAMEISSHALSQHRAAGIQLSAAAITNITQDHFDYHLNMDAYRKAKASISTLLYPEAPLLLNLDDPGCQLALQNLAGSVPVVTCGIRNCESEISGEVLRKSHRSTTVRLRLAQGDCDLRLKMVGDHNVSNCLIAAGLAEQLGIRLEAIVDGLQALDSVPGRLQRIDSGQPFQVFVDYAHTPHALQHCLQTLRSFTTGRIICVFGAGGDRDRSKRPAMGAAVQIADLCIVTSDNPRSESPEAIIADIMKGIPATTEVLPVVQRESAIDIAIHSALAGDTVVIAGRGHETMQEVNGDMVPLNDSTAAESALNTLGYGSAPAVPFARSA